MPDDEEDYDQIEHREVKEKILSALSSAALTARAPFLKEGDEINVFAYGGEDKIAEHLDVLVPHKPRMTKAAQYVSVIGSYLYEQNPTRRAEPREWAGPEALSRAQWMEKYLNYIPKQTDLKTQFRRNVIQACIYGKGVIWPGWDKDMNIVTAVFDQVQNLLVDPDARSKEECNWKARIRRKPRWWLLKHFPEAKACIMKLSPDSKPRSAGSKGTDYTTDTITFYEMYFRIGLHNYDGGKALLTKAGDGNEEGESVGDDTPMKFLFSASGKLIAETSWEVPLYRKKLWPCIELDFIDNPGHYWPKSPIWAGLSQLKNMNWLYRHMMARVRAAARAFLIIMSKNGVGPEAEDIDKLLDVQPSPDGVWDLIRINANGTMENAKIQELVQQLKLDADQDSFLKAIAFEEQEFEKATGLYGILFQGAPEQQMRSAAEVQFREKTSRSRIDDMLSCVEAASDELAAAQAMYARFLSTPEDIGKIMGPEAAQGFGQLMPELADETQRFAAELLEMGAPPEIAEEMGRLQAQEQEMMLLQQGGVTFETWLMETDYSVAGGSTRRKDVDEEKEVYAEASNQFVPALFKTNVPALMGIGLRIEQEKYRLIGASQELLNNMSEAIAIVMAPPPPPMIDPVTGMPIPPPPGPGQPMAPPGPPPGMEPIPQGV
jgi:hypothetical protein